MEQNSKFCSICGTCFSYQLVDTKLFKVCRKCGSEEEEKKGALLVETYVQERTSEAYKVLVNEFTRQDPTLPHVKTIKCPNGGCESNQGKVERDVIYMKYDAVNMKYLYICDVCGQQWRSR
jgi:DNA-directed RNA polymerase subunit M/transcription elongation factor TFIIS